MAEMASVVNVESSSSLPALQIGQRNPIPDSQTYHNPSSTVRNTGNPRGNRRGGRGRGNQQQTPYNYNPEYLPNNHAVNHIQHRQDYLHDESAPDRIPAGKRGRGQSRGVNQSNNQQYGTANQPINQQNVPVNQQYSVVNQPINQQYVPQSEGNMPYQGARSQNNFRPPRGISGVQGGYTQQPERIPNRFNNQQNDNHDDWQRGAPRGHAPPPRQPTNQSNSNQNLNLNPQKNRVGQSNFGGSSQDARRNTEMSVQNGFRQGRQSQAVDRQSQAADRQSQAVVQTLRSEVGEENVAPRNAPVRSAPSQTNFHLRNVKVEDKNQRERLTEELTKEKLECQFCCERIWSKQPTWSCDGCYNVFHLKCVRGWAVNCKKESEDGTWRCMICYLILLEEPRQYLCFCRKQVDPEWNPNMTPHSCGEVCGKGSAKGHGGRGCDHPCVCLCHPGPCPPCQRLVVKSCGCGKTTIQDQCNSTSSHVCDNVCGKVLNCETHRCALMCHAGPCADCAVSVEKTCFCGRELRLLTCLESTASEVGRGFACFNVCGGKLTCGNHFCGRVCHPGDCLPCLRSPAFVKKCPCGKHFLEEDVFFGVGERRSCLDVIPGCGEVCGKVLSCGTGKSPHFCQEECHDGACPPCGKKTAVNCCCGSSTQVVPCAQLTPEIRQWKCPKKCLKKMLCGRHKCENICCNYEEHICWKQCQKKLSCGLHLCEDPCGHPGGCRRCLNTSFEERTCRCGATVQHPPIPCGAPLPDCPRPCSLLHPCGHPPTHSCHGDAECPPCTFLCEKTCFKGHEVRRNVPCHVQGLSCGKVCSQKLDCGVHYCKKVCHAGACQVPGEGPCKQLCPVVERKCGHPCNVLCHGKMKCPVTQCKAVVDVTCECRLRKEKIACWQHEKLLKDYLKRQQAQELGGLKTLKLDELRYAMPVDVLECDEECRKVERNKSLASALNIDPDVETSSFPGLPVYSEPLKQTARENIRWAAQIENSIITLVKTVRETGATRRHQLQPMNFEKRKFVHELAEFYGCQTQSFDQEPVRAVVLIAKSDSVQMPSTPLFQVLAAERPAKQTAKCPAVSSRGVVAAGGIVEKERFSWPVEMPHVGSGGSGGGGGSGGSLSHHVKNKSVPTVDYFEVTD